MSAATDAQLQALVDRAAIHDLLMRYASAVDRYDFGLVGSCFTPDAFAIYNDLEFSGRDSIVEYVSGVRHDKVNMHFMGNQTIDLHGDTADVETYCLAFRVGERSGEDFVIVTGIRYEDQAVRHDGEWLIHRRHHHPDWRTEHDVTLPGR